MVKRSKTGVQNATNAGKFTKSKHRGAAKEMDNELREHFGGVAGRADQALFFEDKDDSQLPRGLVVRRMKKAKAEKKALDKLAGLKPKSSLMEDKLVKRMSLRTKDRAEEKETMRDVWAEDTAPTRRERQIMSKKSTNHATPALRVAPASASYNPSVAAFEEGMKQMVAKEVEFIDRSKVKYRPGQNDPKLKSLPFTPAADDASARSEEESEDEQVDMVEDEEVPESNRKRKARLERGERVTRTMRNKMKRKREELKISNARKAKRELMKQIDSVDTIVAEVEMKEKQIEANIELRKQRALEALEGDAPIKLNGKTVYLAPNVDVILPGDLTDNMRQLKPHGGMINERVASLLSRGKVAIGHNRKITRYVFLHCSHMTKKSFTIFRLIIT